ncbi:hypothetical protein ACVWZ4_007402 [Bradyrhizobium sp. USDA 4472]
MHKSLRSSPLRGSKSRQGCSRWRGQRCRGGRSTRLTGGIKRGPAPRCGSHTGPLYGMTKIALTKAPTSLLECAVDIPARKKLIQTMPLDIDRPINRAVVLGCAISATRNYLKLHRSQTLKILFCNTRAETRKLWKRSAWFAASRSNARRSIHRLPVAALHPPAEIPTALSSVPWHAEIHATSCSRRACHRTRHPTCDPHSARCSAGALPPVTSCLGAFWTPASGALRSLLVAGLQKPAHFRIHALQQRRTLFDNPVVSAVSMRRRPRAGWFVRLAAKPRAFRPSA